MPNGRAYIFGGDNGGGFNSDGEKKCYSLLSNKGQYLINMNVIDTVLITFSLCIDDQLMESVRATT